MFIGHFAVAFGAKRAAPTVSLACMLLAAALLSSRSAQAQDMSILMGGERGNPFSITFDDAIYKGNGTPEIDESRASINIPLYTTDEASALLYLRGQRVKLDKPLVIPDRSYQTPEDFGSAEIGFGWSRRDVIGNATGFTSSIGSSGRRLLSDENSRVLGATWFMEKAEPDGNSWIYVINYSNNRTFLNNIPLPGIAYSINSKDSKLLLGIPFIFYFKRAGPAMLTASLSPFHASLDGMVFVLGPIQVFSGLSWAPKAYQNLVPGNDTDRLFYDKKDWTTGVRVPVSRKTSFSLAYVHGFDRRFLLGEKITQPTSSSVHLDDVGGIQFRAKIGF